MRDQHAAGGGHAEVRLEQRRDVRAQHGDAVALLEAARPQRRGEPVAAPPELGVVVAPLAVDDRRALGQRQRVAAQERQRRQLYPKGRWFHGAS